MPPLLTDQDIAKLEANHPSRVGDVKPESPVVDNSAPKQPQVLSDQDIAGLEAESEKYDRPIEAGLQGAARGLSFGLSDVAQTATGFRSPEDLSKLKDYNPTASTVGEVAGVGIPLLATAGTSALAEGAAEVGSKGLLTAFGESAAGAGARKVGAGVLGVSKIGQTVEKAVAKSLTGDIGAEAAKSTARKIVESAAAQGAGSAVEGAFYGGGKVISDAALGDPDLNAEKVLSTIGLSTVFGGALGGSFGALKEAAPSLMEAAKNATSRISEIATTGLDNAAVKVASTAAKVSGKDEPLIQNLMQNPFTEQGMAVRKSAMSSDKEIQHNLKSSVEAFQEQFDHMKEVKGVLDELRPAQREVFLGELDPVDPNAALGKAGQLNNFLKSSIKEMRAEPEVYSATGRVRQLEMIQEGLEKNLTKLSGAESVHATDVFDAIDDAKSLIAKQAKFDKIATDSEVATVNKIKEVGGAFKNHLEDPEVYGSAGIRHAESNAAYSDYLSAEKEFRKRFMEKVQTKSGVEYKIKPSAVNSYLKDVQSANNVNKDFTLNHYIESSQKLLNQVEQSFNPAVNSTEAAAQTDAIAALRKPTDEFKSTLDKEVSNQKLRQDYKGMKARESGINPIEIAGGALALHLGGPVVLGAMAALKLFNNPALLVDGLAAIERAAMSSSKTIKRGVDAFLKKAPTEGIPILQPSLVVFNQSKFGDEKKSKSDSTHSAFNKRLNELSEFASNPSMAADKVAKATAPFQKVAPNIAASMQPKIVNMMNYLYQTAPKDPLAGQTLQFGPKKDFIPSDTELSKWQRRMAIVENPMHILQELNQGTLTPESVDALKVNYPKIYEQMTTTLLDRAAELRKTISYRDRLQLSQLFQVPIEATMRPDFIQSMQAKYSEQQVGPEGPMPSGGGMKTGSLEKESADSLQTPVQKIQNR